MAHSGVIKNGSPISMEEAEHILDMAIQTAKRLRDRLAQFNKSSIKKDSLKEEQKERL